ncbi:MAG: PQQ-binding-like beta-propeller repeat protein [Planctomycetaceae bacterium]|nr:PQQ-binding-like beta-propeller repeat protein [Planctomycetaceae bacterium]
MRRSRNVTVMLRTCLTLTCVMLIVGAATDSVMADQWPRFRGDNGTGVSELKGLPTSWTESDYEWVVKLPGVGHSSPVIWDEALFLTTALEDGTRTLHRFNAITGEEVWSRSTLLEVPTLHGKSSMASSTAALDGERVYSLLADDNQNLVQAHTFDGELVWQKDLGPYTSQHGIGVSPIIYEDLLIVMNEQAGPSSIVALNRQTGDEVWHHGRPSKEVSYSTPMILSLDGRAPQLICAGEPGGVISLNPLDGTEIWTTAAMPLRTVSSMVYGNGVVIASCGSGGMGKYMRAIDPTGSGDVTATHIRYERLEKEHLHYVPTPIVLGENLFLWCDRGIVCCVEMASGRTIWFERIGGGNYSGSPIIVDGKLYCVSEEGEVVVLSAGPEFREYGRSPLGEGSHASPAVANGRLYIRGFQRLVSLRAKSMVEAAGAGK